MFILIVLLALIVWLLWTLHQDLLEANQRQRNVKMELIRLIDRVEQMIEQRDNEATVAIARVGLNSASKTQLRTLPKIGAIVAERIIGARPFNSIEQLRDVEGVSGSLYDTIVARVSLD